MRYFILLAAVLGACTAPVQDSVVTAQPYIGLEERTHRRELKDLVGVDPVRTEWCAAFVNAVLEMDGIPGSSSVSDTPLMARSFLSWGTGVHKSQIQRGDVVVFPRGTQGWQGHVGFYVETRTYQGRDYWLVLGGNQDNTVNYQLFDPRTSLGVRRWIQDRSLAGIL